jgi:hypothetical protein
MNGFTELYRRLRVPDNDENVIAKFQSTRVPLDAKKICSFCGGEATHFGTDHTNLQVDTLQLWIQDDYRKPPEQYELFGAYWVCPSCFHVCSRIVELFERSKK